MLFFPIWGLIKNIYEKNPQKKERQFEKEKHIKQEKAETMRKIIYMLKDHISFIKCEKML